MKIKQDISDMTITVNAAEFAHILALALKYERLRKDHAATQAKNCRMRNELTRYQAFCEARKREMTSGAGASDEPQPNETNAQAKSGAVSLTNEAEGRVSGGERAKK